MNKGTRHQCPVFNEPQRNSMPIVQDDVLNALKQCYDPEIPVNIVDLGLIYEIRFDDVPEGQQDVTIEMTLTAQGCPVHVNISAQVKSRVEQLPGVRNANVNVVWSPPWTPERLCTDARKQLGIEYPPDLPCRDAACRVTFASQPSILPQLLKRRRRALFHQLLDPAAEL